MFTVQIVTTKQANKTTCQLCNRPYKAGDLRAGHTSDGRRDGATHAHVDCINKEAARCKPTPKVKLNPNSNLAYAYCAAGRLP